MSPPEAPAQRSTEALYEDAPCGLLLADATGIIIRANRTFCRWLGVDAEALVGKRRFQDLLGVGGRIFHQTHFLPLLQMQGSVSEVKLDMRRADGGTMPIVINAVRHRHDNGWHDELAIFIATDRHTYERELMLARKRAEDLAARQLDVQEELRRADRRKDEFLAMLAHELRNPLAPISTAAHLLRQADGDPASLRRVGDVIARQASHLTRLVDDLLDVSRVTRGLIELERETLPISEVVEAAVEQARPLIEARRHALRLHVECDAMVEGDRTRLVQIVTNLLNNAAKYTPQAGAIDVVIDTAGEDVTVEVSDTGAGIDASLLPHIFDLFSQGERTPDRSQGGLGIGLALVRSLTALHGGQVMAHSEGRHRGSRFTLRLPIVVRTLAAPANAPASMQGCAPVSVMVVDDNTDAALMLAEALTLFGHRVMAVHTAEQALANVDSHAAEVYILDIGLPDIDGYQLAGRIRERVGGGPLLIALTGYGQPHDRVLSKAAGFEHHLVKPVDLAALESILARVGSRQKIRATA